MTTDAPFTQLQTALKHRFSSTELLLEALTHKSFSNEQGEKRPADNERLEFLGDAVLQLIVTRFLFESYPDAREGDMTRGRADVVSETSLARLARKLSLGKAIRLGRGEEKSGGRDKDGILADTMEAVLGALYLDGGWDAASVVVRDHVAQSLSLATLQTGGSDYKTRLQELAQARYGELPIYLLEAAEGPDHQKSYRVSARIHGEQMGQGQGSSKKMAEQQAAKQALKALGEDA